MTIGKTEDIQKLIDQIDTLITTIATAGDVGRNKLKDIKIDESLKEALKNVPLTPDKKVDTAKWAKLEEKVRKEIHQRLTKIRNSLHSAVGLDGPTDPNHIMYAGYASTKAIITWAVIGLLLTASLLSAIVFCWDRATGTEMHSKTKAAILALDGIDKAKGKVQDVEVQLARLPDANLPDQEREEKVKELKSQVKAQLTYIDQSAQDANFAAVEGIRAIAKGGASERAVLLMVILLGGLGGSLHFLRSLVSFVGNRKFMRSWLLYYLSTPFTGAGLAMVVYMMLRVGLLNPSGTTADGSAVVNLNLIAIYAFAILTGLFARTALDKLHQVFTTLFQTKRVGNSVPASKDTLDSEETSADASSTTEKSP